MKNTIILTSYNRTYLLRQAIESALNQTVPVDLIIVDDGSGAETLAIIEEYAPLPNVTYIQTNKKDESRGAINDYTDNINKALNLVDSGNVYYLVCDDYFSPRHVELLAEALDKNPSWAVVFGCQQVLQYDDNTHIDKPKFIRQQADVVPQAACRVDHIQVGHRRSLIDEIGLWPTHVSTYGAGDAAFWDKINKKYPFHKATKEITNFNRHHKKSIQGL